ncbi:thioesterase family protein [Actinoplanes awajinensis]|uniref:Acyl-CoA thioesterase n=1 Tax=Actinoplanes awajinensis subsp. mycoplanecinus TaxID=135947 RepID=A0A101JPK8_9ACTN|nr:thioesterase family protein [Actinoplanes awajinensis]KUL30823.1 acyl-CoA thioesterase [Actinoplanes awajinensis subsp. mycoplanecinus]
MQSFAQATAVQQTPGGFRADLDPQWGVGDKLHGGYLMAVIARAVATQATAGHRDAAGGFHPHPIAMTTTFLRAPRPGEVAVEVELLRAGRGSSQFRARLTQAGETCAESLVTQGLLDDAAPWWSALPAPEIPAEDDCFLLPANPPGAGFTVHLLDVVEHRLDPACLGFAAGHPSKNGQTSGWLRLADGTDWDPLALLVALDPSPPISLTLGIQGWAPTISLTAYLRHLPAPGPLRMTMQSAEVTSGRMDETAQLWDAKGALVAQATQLAAVRP